MNKKEELENLLNSIDKKVFKDKVLPKLMIKVLEDTLTTFDHEEYKNIYTIISKIIDMYKNGGTDKEKGRDVKNSGNAARTAYAARTASAAAYCSAWAAAYAAYAKTDSLYPASAAVDDAAWAAAYAAYAKTDSLYPASANNYEKIMDENINFVVEILKGL